MGVVWRAADELLGRSVAVKALSLDTGADPAGALREARAVAQIRHPHVIVVHDVVEHEGQPVIVMELVDGGSLADRLAAPDGTFSPREAAGVGLDLLGALSAGHAHGVLHRDVKPANVLLEAGTGRVVLTDFGIASLPGTTTISGTGMFAGTPEYSAPERMQGAAGGPASDLWSLGALLCAAVAGESPFRRDSLGAVLHAVVYEEIRPTARLGPLLPVVRGLLERDPERRMGAAEARRLLAACAAGDRSPAEEETASGAASGAGAVYTPTEQVDRAPDPVDDGAGRENRIDRDRPAGREGRPRPRLRGARAALVVAGAVAACAGAVTAVTLLDGRTAKGPGGSAASAPPVPAPPGSAAPSTASPAPSTSSPSPTDPVPSPGGSVSVPVPSPASPTPPQSGGVPAGYTKVQDLRGFSLNVPRGTVRSTDGERTFYITADGAVRVGIKFGTLPPGGAMGSMLAADERGPVNNKGYRDNRVTATTHRGLPAAFWEFTWDGFSAAEGARHTYDLAWEQNGTLYDVWVSAPVGRSKEAHGIFSTAVDSFAVSGH
ncbi:serine/threonine-protein kinase [Streptomyces sp. NPDC090445]|uniref:serine/threonine-protein kinase n=1 Tax=Streptomyces sp. NPDC090445 TaxID=3365963 RepID=UPI0038204964